ncbi:DUF1766-domain-containing protein [Didymella exigua CBS 183.55]|uniref:DUF1766-domain-containing protein n=1 Tax=Didymella exigua CBS 183.55 TaxID=1150837 RepID=A0A6A5S325_9PLEO|nr:DUF1766-domain-containing protein [Didymella exigua CBS 183.55]KAF1933738.1 DUF1766-domain-containing protein [Didymella exigua CBS 183.55]
MTFIGRTPESLILRSDSRNPATTCKGITKSGRPCRRPIDAKVSEDDGVLAVVSVAGDSDSEDIGAAAYFCWQHKDQAEQLAATKSDGPDTQLYPLKERSSIDTLVQRLGVLEVDDAVQEPHRKRRDSSKKETGSSGNRPPRRINRPATWDRVEGPLISVPSDVMAAQKQRRNSRPSKPPPQTKKSGFWQSLCCGAADDDEIEVIRHKKRTSHRPEYAADTPMQQMPQMPPRPQQTHGSRPSAASAPRPVSRTQAPGRKLISSTVEGASEKGGMLRYIPQNVSPQLAATLLAELSKPISQHDDEGYIYIFWLTPEASGPAPSSAASTILTPPSQPGQARRTSDVLRQYSVKHGSRPRSGSTRQRSSNDEASGVVEKDTILLKIGRANNVHRRMNEWTRQCGYSLSLVRFYPYISSSTPTPSPQASPTNSRRTSAHNVKGNRGASDAGIVRKVPTVMRVERMIHLELVEQRVMKKCDACGKQHQEWFEVDATKDGVKKVDEVIKRWVEWAERANEERMK